MVVRVVNQRDSAHPVIVRRSTGCVSTTPWSYVGVLDSWRGGSGAAVQIAGSCAARRRARSCARVGWCDSV